MGTVPAGCLTGAEEGTGAAPAGCVLLSPAVAGVMVSGTDEDTEGFGLSGRVLGFTTSGASKTYNRVSWVQTMWLMHVLTMICQGSDNLVEF